ncbi:MAG: exodeoxyribonuclease III [Bacteroidota bacterium]
MKICTYNVNGIRAALKKGLADWVAEEQPDILALQEIKIDQQAFRPYADALTGYTAIWHSAEKKGYSGVAIYAKNEPEHVQIGFDQPKYDIEGRVISASFGDLRLVNVYLPSGSQGDARQVVKEAFMDDFYDWLQTQKAQHEKLVVVGDYNICHKPIDIHDPVRLKNTSGFLPNEREWMSKLIDSGFIDSFREVNTDPDLYTWFSYRARAKANNKGWRIDYQLINTPLKDAVIAHEIHRACNMSDHVPTVLELEV